MEQNEKKNCKFEKYQNAILEPSNPDSVAVLKKIWKDIFLVFFSMFLCLRNVSQKRQFLIKIGYDLPKKIIMESKLKK